MSDAGIWYIGINGQQHGPLATQQVMDMIRAGQIDRTAYAYGQTAPQWTPIAQIPWFGPMFTQAPAPPPPPAGPAPIVVDEIDYEIGGSDSQYVDITLDPFPYNGATTTCESLWMGVPVITLAGKVHAGRVGVSLLKTLGMSDFIAETTDGYVRKAVVLSANKNGLTNLRHTLRSRMHSSSLCDGPRFTKDVEGLFRQMWTRWCKGQATTKQAHGDSGSILSLRE